MGAWLLAQRAARRAAQATGHPSGPPASVLRARLSRDQFFQRIAQREGADLPDTVYHARVVLEVLKEAVSAGELQDVRQQLPPEIEQLFDAGSQGELPRR